jgi:hypothetical protein
MKLWINGEEDSASYTQDTLGDLLDHLQEKKNAQNQFLLKVQVDDQTVEFAAPNVRKTALTAIQKLDIEFEGLPVLIDRNMSNAENYLSRLIPGIEKASELFRTGNEQEANRYFLNIIDGIDWFSQVMDSIIEAKKIDLSNTPFNGQTIQARKDKLLDLTQQVLEANKNKDWVLVADLLEYEIFPYYQDWAAILPEIKGIQPDAIH